MWSKLWHLPRKESFGVTASGSGVLSPPVTDCKMVHRLSNTLPVLRFRHWKFITEDKSFSWCLNFYPFSYFSLFISLSFCSAKACHISSDKQTSTSLSPTDIRRSQFHHLRCHDRWWCNTLRLRHNICSDSLQGQVRACSQIKPFCLVVVVDCWLQFRHGFVIMHQKKYRSEQLNRAVEGL